tara:strand:- start:370 stop:1215 length:846 start_codon:yes stop_codon:yes gene_type:complete
MKIILGDNQFFGVNHFDLNKGEKTKLKFDTKLKIESFIKDSLEIGLDGFMINSNDIGYDIISGCEFDNSKETHYSIPYPHKYASMINEKGMISLLRYVIKNTSFIKNIIGGIKLISTQNLRSITPLALDLEVPKDLKKGSYIHLQNIITDLLIGMGRGDILIEFIKYVVKMGYKPGIITLNPIMLDNFLKNEKDTIWLKDLIVCFNINKEGFNVFPSLDSVECFIESRPKYKLMGMSVFASGASNIPESVKYIKKLNLDYVVFGSSKIENINSNLNLFNKK